MIDIDETIRKVGVSCHHLRWLLIQYELKKILSETEVPVSNALK